MFGPPNGSTSVLHNESKTSHLKRGKEHYLILMNTLNKALKAFKIVTLCNHGLKFS